MFVVQPLKVVSRGARFEWVRVQGSHSGGMSRVQQANADLDLVVWWEDSAQVKWHMTIDCMGEGFNPGIIAAVHLALALKPNISVFSCMYLVPLKSLDCVQGEGLQVHKSVCGPYMWICGFTAAFSLNLRDRISADCCGQISWGLLFPELEP